MLTCIIKEHYHDGSVMAETVGVMSSPMDGGVEFHAINAEGPGG